MYDVRAHVRTNSRDRSNKCSGDAAGQVASRRSLALAPQPPERRKHATRGSNMCLKWTPRVDYLAHMATRDQNPGNARGSSAHGTVSEMPDAAPDATGLTPRQQRILNTLRESIEKRGYPPSIREIGELVGLTSSSSVAHQLRVLEQKGFIKRDPNRPRALEVFIPEL